MTVSVLQFSLLFGSFIALICSIIYALSQNMKHKAQLKEQAARISELELRLN